MNKDFFKKIFYQSLTGFLSLALAILFYFAIKNLNQIQGVVQWWTAILKPFVYGGAMAYLLKTPCGFLERQIETLLPENRKKWANTLSVAAVMVLGILIIYLLLNMIIPEIITSIMALAAVVPQKIEELSDWVLKHLDGNELLQNYVNNAFTNVETWLKDWATTDLLPTVQGMMGGAVTAVTSVVTVFKNIVLGLIICLYALLGRKRFTRQGKALVYSIFKPEWAQKVLKEFSFIDKTFVGFFGGKILDSAVIGLICYVFCMIMTAVAGFQNAVLISVIIGVTNVIPYFGPFIGAVPSALLIFISSPRNCLIFLIFIVVLQQFDGNILGPKLLAGSVGLTGFWVLFAITLFQGLFGFVGILVGVPVFAVIYDLVKRAILLGLEKHEKMHVLTGRPPDPPEEPSQD